MLAALNKMWQEEEGKDCGFRLDEWYFTSVAYADDTVVLATSQKALEQMVLDLTEGFRETDLEICELELNTQVTRPLAASGRRKGGMDRQTDTRLDVHDAQRKLSTIDTKPHETITRSTQKKKHNAPRCPYLNLNQRMEALAKAVWPRMKWEAPAWHSSKTWQEKRRTRGASMVADTARQSGGQERQQKQTWWIMNRLQKKGPMTHGQVRKGHFYTDGQAKWQGQIREHGDTTSTQETRGLQCWRDAPTKPRSKWDGVHPKRFSYCKSGKHKF